MDAKVYELINDQINKELHSAYLYLSFADYYEEEGLSGYANYFEIQAQEERDHAMIFRNYLHENGEAVKLLAIDMPDKTFANFLEPLEAAMEHEKYVTSLINDIYTAALEAHDYRAQKFLGWFIDEQLEEEDNADTMITNMKLFGGDPMWITEAVGGIGEDGRHLSFFEMLGDFSFGLRRPHLHRAEPPGRQVGRRACHPWNASCYMLAADRAPWSRSAFCARKGWNPSCSTRTRTSTLPRNTPAAWLPCANGPRTPTWKSWKAPTTPRLGRPLPAA